MVEAIHANKAMKRYGTSGAGHRGDLGPVYSERQCQCCDVAGDIALIKLLRLINYTESQLRYTDVASDITLFKLFRF